jgi:peptidoglycan hydrolase-like protein with peptidoglycan-binding domain
MTIKLSKPFAPNSQVDEYDVRQIKKALNRLGYYQPYEKTGITGIPDREVFEALKEFQKDNSLQPTGETKPGDESIHTTG